MADSSDITAEKSLWAIWKMARKIPRNRFNQFSSVVTIIIMVLFAWKSNQSPHDIAEMVRNWANIGLGFAGTILGFLIAGFTIFATLSKPSLLAAMAEHKEEESGLSYLKYNFGVFFETFGWYVGFSYLCVSVLVFCPTGGFLTQMISLLPTYEHEIANQWIPRLGAIILATWFIILILELKSFVLISIMSL